MVTRGAFSEALSFLGLSGMPLKEEQLLAIKAGFCYQTLPFDMEHKLGGDRALCPGRYIEYLYFSVKRQHWYRGVPLQK